MRMSPAFAPAPRSTAPATLVPCALGEIFGAGLMIAAGLVIVYYAIKEALINTVHAVHIPWRLIEASTLATLNSELARYRTVFTTNYDLLNYWALQHQGEVIDEPAKALP